ncbi:MAG: hypothetical protein JWN70_1385 [Planctomycetaceae bacterium]|nr:hypothetical protein [Planctomycetaceae bacterium]
MERWRSCPENTADYKYDPLSQLTDVNNGTATTSYAATHAGLLTSTASESTLGYNTAQQLTSLTPAFGPATAFTYDSNGSRISSTAAAKGATPAATTAFSYNPGGDLESVGVPALGSTAAKTISYTSDGDGLRQSRAEGSTSSQFLWAAGLGLPLLLDDDNKTYLHGPSSAPIAQVSGGGTIQYIHGDLLGSTRLITSAAGAVAGATQYDEYGNRLAHAGSAVSAMAYTGNLTDSDTGLVYLRARDYGPASAQFITVDPAVDSTPQPYTYVANNPLQLTDPTGLEFWGDFGNNALAFGAGLLDGATGGLSSMVLGALVPGYNCLIKDNGWFVAGAVVGTIASIALSGGAGAVVAVGRVAAGPAIKLAVSGARRLVTAGIERSVGAVVQRNAARLARRGIEDASKSSPVRVGISQSKYPAPAGHIADAQRAGQPNVVTIDRAGAATRRAEAMRGNPRQTGFDRDEYPPAMMSEGGNGASVKYIGPGDNRGAGSTLSRTLRRYPDGTQLELGIDP